MTWVKLWEMAQEKLWEMTWKMSWGGGGNLGKDLVELLGE